MTAKTIDLYKELMNTATDGIVMAMRYQDDPNLKPSVKLLLQQLVLSGRQLAGFADKFLRLSFDADSLGRAFNEIDAPGVAESFLKDSQECLVNMRALQRSLAEESYRCRSYFEAASLDLKGAPKTDCE